MGRVSDRESDALVRAICLALTGREPAAAPDAAGSLSGRVAEVLAASGLGVQAVVALRAERRAAGLAWPFPVPADERPGIGAAQLRASVKEVCDGLGIGTAPTRVRDAAMPKSAGDARLEAERPPHHGAVG